MMLSQLRCNTLFLIFRNGFYNGMTKEICSESPTKLLFYSVLNLKHFQKFCLNVWNSILKVTKEALKN